MRKSILSMSIAAMIGGLGLAGGASAAVFSHAAKVDGTAASDAVTATKLVVDSTGIGHQLIVPYFSTQNGNITTLNLVNTDGARGKLVKIRIRGASNSDDLLDFQVFLSPSDVWTASIAANKTTGISELTTNDNSCTLPAAMKGTTVPFGTGRLNSKLTGDALAAETREGYIEIINTADIPKDPLAGQGVGASLAAAAVNATSNNVTANPLYTAIKHVSGTAPCTAAALNATLVDPLVATSATAANAANVGAVKISTEAAASTMGLIAPTGQLFGNSIIVNVPSTTTFPSEAVALKAVVAVGDNTVASANLIHFPQVNAAFAGTQIALAAGAGLTAGAATIDGVTADPLLKKLAESVKRPLTATTNESVPAANLPLLAANMLDLPDLSTPYLLLGAEASAANHVYLATSQAATTTQLLAAKSVNNEILGNTGISAKTDWVFSMPTRRYSIAQNYAWVSTATTGGLDGRVMTNFQAAVAAGDIAQPFFSQANTVVGGTNGAQICVTKITSTSFDQSETGVVVSTAASFSPPSAAAPGVVWCGETNVLSFNAGTSTTASVLGAQVARQNVNTTTGVDGWVSLATPPARNTGNGYVTDINAAAALVATGLPVVGSAYIQAFNPAAATGVSGNYGARFLHRFTR